MVQAMWRTSQWYRLCEERHNGTGYVKNLTMVQAMWKTSQWYRLCEEPHNGTGYVKNLRISTCRLCVEPQNRCRLRIARHNSYRLCDVHLSVRWFNWPSLVTWQHCTTLRWHSNKRKPVNPYVVISYYIRWDAIPWQFTLTNLSLVPKTVSFACATFY